MKVTLIRLNILLLTLFLPALQTSAADRWPAKKADIWYVQRPWMVGCNFIPSAAINQLDMWQVDTFDLPTIGRELGCAVALVKADKADSITKTITAG